MSDEDIEFEDSQREHETQLSQEDTLGLLIELVQGYEYLYDLSHKDYKNQIKKEETWKHISQTLQLSVEECQKMWKNLRDRYTREKRSKSGAPAPESKWAFFNKMAFYMKYTKSRKTYSTTPAPSTKQPAELDSASEWSSLKVLLPPSPTVPESSLNDSFNKSVSEVAQKPSVKNKKKLEEDSLLTVAKELSSTIKSRGTLSQNRTFSEHIYSVLEDLPAEEGRLKRRKILEILYDE